MSFALASQAEDLKKLNLAGFRHFTNYHPVADMQPSVLCIWECDLESLLLQVNSRMYAEFLCLCPSE